MKILTIAVPCYNSEAYMKNCIDSLLTGGEDVEILIVNDGSIDLTGEIAEEYARKYPTIVKVIHQENSGHGGAVNTGILNAAGLYFKVVDSDDWVDTDAYHKIIDTLKELHQSSNTIDMLISNYVYEKEGIFHKKTIRYNNVLPENRVFYWNDIGTFHKGQYILMHSVIYRLQILKDCKLELPKHTFYVDNLYVYSPLPYAERLYYINVDFYRYFIGREDQSVNENVMIKRIDQQIRVNKLMIQVSVDNVSIERRQEYMLNYLEIITMISSILLIRSQSVENEVKKQELWNYIKESNPGLYRRLRYGFMGMTVNLPGKMGQMISLTVYKISQKIVGFN